MTRLPWLQSHKSTVAHSGRRSTGYLLGLSLMGLFYVAAGMNHFLNPGFYLAVMPPYIPWPRVMVEVSGVAEVLGGIGVLIPDGFVFRSTRRAAAWGVVALLVAVLPVHISMFMHPERFLERFPGFPLWAIWLRLPLQLPLIAWAVCYTRD